MEREPKSQEHLNQPRSPELEAAAGERLQELEKSAEAAEQTQAEKLQAARETLEKHAEAPAEPAERKAPDRRHPSLLDKTSAYWQTLKSLQSKLPPASRTFSKIIHAPAVEKASEVVGKTVMRPSVTFGATLTALIVGGTVYLTAKRYGFLMSGPEFAASLLVGGVLGAAGELIFNIIKKVRS